MEYKVVPFVAVLDHKTQSSGQVAEQLQKKIDKYVGEGWTYVRVEGVTTYVNPDSGCFGVGAKPGYTTSSQVIVFKR